MNAGMFLSSFLIGIALLAHSPVKAAETVVIGERVMTTAHPAARARNADGSDRLTVTSWYPATASEGTNPAGSGLLEATRTVIPDAKPAAGIRPVILLSHGFGGSAQAMSWFAAAMAGAGYIVIAVDHPGNAGNKPMTTAGAAMFFERPGDLVAAFHAVNMDSRLGPLVDRTRIAVAGFSAGGFTALSLAGASVDSSRLRRFCQRHPSDGVCRPQLEFAVPIDAVLAILESDRSRKRLADIRGARHGLALGAVFVMAPAVVQSFDPFSLRAMRVPVTLVLGGSDTVAPNETNGEVAAALLPNARRLVVKGASHYDFLGKCTSAGRSVLPFCDAQREADAAHRTAITQALALFARTIGPARN